MASASAADTASEVGDGPRRTNAVWSSHAVSECRRDWTVGPAAGGGTTLVDRDLVRDEIGRTVHSEARVAAETVGGDLWVRKDFALEAVGTCAAELCVFTDGPVEIAINGRALPPYERVHIRARPYDGVYPADKFPEGHAMRNMNGKPYHEYWQGGWERIPLTPGLLSNGLNTVILRAKPGEIRRFRIEPSLHPNRSAVSRDGGATWDYDHLSTSRVIDGEYVVRLALQRHPASGWVESDPADLWPRPGGGVVALPTRLIGMNLDADAVIPAGTRLTLQARLGTTPEFSPATWTGWGLPAELAKGCAGGKAWPAGARFVQWRAELLASADRLNAPVLRAVSVAVTDAPPTTSTMAAPPCRLTQRRIVRPSHPFAHAGNSERLRILREHTAVDKVVADKPRGIPQLLALAQWTYQSFGANASGQLKMMNNWDALTLWHNARGENRLTGQMCTTRAAFFVQCATALGYPARPCIWSHAITEVWVEEIGKWVAFDPSHRTCYYELDGQPASMREVSTAWSGASTGSATGKVFEVKGPEARNGPLDNGKLAWFARFWIPMRSNFLESPEPEEPGHGTTAFKYDGYLQWLHPAKKPLPWFSHYTCRRGDIDFTVNTVNLHLALGRENGVVDVRVETDEPAPARIEARFGKGDWAEVGRTFSWKPEKDGYPLEVRSVNAFGVPGGTARVDDKNQGQDK